MSVDPLPGSVDNPQSLDRYVNVTDDPVNLIDPLGLYCYEHVGHVHCTGETVYVYGDPRGYPSTGGGGGGGGGNHPDHGQRTATGGSGGGGLPSRQPTPLPLPPIVPLCQGLFGPATVSSPFGNTNPPWYSALRPHMGVDFVNNGIDFNVNAVRGGTVVESRIMSGFGHAVIVEAAPQSFDIYGGLSLRLVLTGKPVSAGQHIATAGATFLQGVQRGSAPHLHFQRIEGSLWSGRFVNHAASVRPCQ